MRKLVCTLAASLFIAGLLFTGCTSSSKKIEHAEDKVLDAKEAVIDAQSDLNLARQDSITEFQQLKTAFQNQISANEKSIAGLKLKIVDASQENRELYEKKLAELEEKNNDLKIKLAEFKEGETDQWETFKLEFKRDLDELGKAFSDFTVSSKE
jgi:plasmid maintenance system killer protein